MNPNPCLCGHDETEHEDMQAPDGSYYMGPCGECDCPEYREAK